MFSRFVSAQSHHHSCMGPALSAGNDCRKDDEGPARCGGMTTPWTERGVGNRSAFPSPNEAAYLRVSLGWRTLGVGSISLLSALRP